MTRDHASLSKCAAEYTALLREMGQGEGLMKPDGVAQPQGWLFRTGVIEIVVHSTISTHALVRIALATGGAWVERAER